MQAYFHLRGNCVPKRQVANRRHFSVKYGDYVLKLIYFNGKFGDSVKFGFLTTATIFWNVIPCSVVDVKVYQCFGGSRCLHHQGSKEHDISFIGVYSEAGDETLF
jgi:hypothetical protein